MIIEVADNGGGIAAENLPYLFDPYFTSKEKDGGTGLGLYICRMIIEDGMSGRVECDNRDDGAVLTITLEESKDA